MRGLLAVLTAVAILPLAVPAGARGRDLDANTGRLLVTTAPGTTPAVILQRAQEGAGAGELRGVRLVDELAGERVGVVVVPPGREDVAAVWLRGVPGVVGVDRDERRPFAALPDDPSIDDQWAHRMTGAIPAWDVVAERTGGVGDGRVRVAILDSGVRGDHLDLRANVVAQADATASPVAVVGPGVDNDTCGLGHGTAVAGVVGAAGDNDIAIAGVVWRVAMIDIALASRRDPASCEGGGVADSTVLRGLEHAVALGADVAVLSIAGADDGCPAAYRTALQAARDAGVLVVAAAGNGELRASTRGLGTVPGSCDGVVAVGAVGRDGEVTGYSTTNPWVDLVAPGGLALTAGGCAVDAAGCVVSTDRGGGVAAGEGTSYAAPYVAGVAALVLSVRPTATPDQLESLLERTARDLAQPGRDPATGWGLVQADQAVLRALEPRDPQPSAADPAFAPGPTGQPGGPPAPSVRRIAGGAAGRTEAVSQAIAVSRATFATGGAAHAVLARSDAYADALAGTSLGYGVGPLLFLDADGRLGGRTVAELRRVLPRGGIVYLLGGQSAVPAAVADALVEAGWSPVRLAGAGREETAAAVARELGRRLPAIGAAPPSAALLATRDDWPDAVSAGALGSYLGIPVLLAGPTLAASTDAALQELAPTTLYVVGGTGAVTAEVARAAQTAAGARRGGAGTVTVVRLAGESRDETAVAVARELESQASAAGRPPRSIVAVNLSRSDGFAHALSASALLGAFGGLLVPVLGDGGTVLPASAATLVRGRGLPGAVAGGTDLVAESTRRDLEALLATRG